MSTVPPADGSDDHRPDEHRPDEHRPDLHGPDLHGPDLHGPDLHGPDLHGPDLGPVIVGVEHDQPTLVLREAARFASDLGTDLVCAHVDTSRYPVDEHDDGSVTSMPLDPEVPDIRDEVIDPELEEYVRSALSGSAVSLRFVALAGDPAQSLAELGETLAARAIVVGTRRPGFRAGLEKFFTGSIAVRLAHRQKRPVIVIPLEPHSSAAPWEFEA